jgi:hypothetical protein
LVNAGVWNQGQIPVGAVANLGSVIPGRHRQVANPESITFGPWLWIPGSGFAGPGLTLRYGSNFEVAEPDGVTSAS